MTFKLVEDSKHAVIKVVGVGGGGGNAVNTMVESGLQGVDFIVANTDIQVLRDSRADVRIQLGPTITKGLGAGANPERGREAAEESIDEIKECLRGSDMVFITAGLGGGTGTGAAPVIARVSKELGILTVGVVTRPFIFEGNARRKNADKGWQALREHVDTIITIPNDRLIALSGQGTKFMESMKMADDVLVQAVKGITDLINLPGFINPDFADVRTIMSETGPALMGAGIASGENRAAEAVEKAIASPLLQDANIDGARGVLVNISTRQDSLTMAELTVAMSKIREEVHEDATIIFGVIFDEGLGDAMRVTVIATGIETVAKEVAHENVKPLLPPKKEKPASHLPYGDQGMEENQSSEQPGARMSVIKSPNRRPIPRNYLDEVELDRPTFMRKNEN